MTWIEGGSKFFVPKPILSMFVLHLQSKWCYIKPSQSVLLHLCAIPIQANTSFVFADMRFSSLDFHWYQSVEHFHLSSTAFHSSYKVFKFHFYCFWRVNDDKMLKWDFFHFSMRIFLLLLAGSAGVGVKESKSLKKWNEIDSILTCKYTHKENYCAKATEQRRSK